MALGACRECREAVSTEAAVCPHCGCPNPTAVVSPAESLSATCPAATERDEQSGLGAPVAAVRSPPLRWLFSSTSYTVIGLALCAVGVGLRVHTGEDVAFSLGYSLGFVGLPVMLLWPVLRRWPGVSILVLGAGVLALGASSAYHKAATEREARGARRALRTIAETAREIQEGRPLSDPVRTGKPGDFAVLADFTTAFLREQEASRKRYEERMDALGIDTIIAPESFASPEGIADARRRLGALRDLMHSYQREALASLDGLESRATALPVAESLKQSFLDGFRRSKRTSVAALNRYFEIEEQLILACEDMHSLMVRETGCYEVRRGNVLFVRPEAADEYNEILERALRLAAEEGKALAAMGKTVNESIGRLEREAE